MSILAQILATKREELAVAKARVPLAQLVAQLGEAEGPREAAGRRPFAAALRRPTGASVRVIAEFKRASPSAGGIAPGAEIEPIARRYEEAGATAISVLTDERYFDGAAAFLGRARAVVALPLLRKDFLIDPYQVMEAKLLGADAVLLIVAALSDADLTALMGCAADVGLETLVEVHDEREAERAVKAGATVIGVNHRNLKTFEMDMGLTARLRAAVPTGVVLVGESGIRGRADLERLGADGADAVLVGESLMRAADPGAALAELLS